MTDSEYNEKRAELIESGKEHKQEVEQKQAEILDSIQEEHGGDLIETEVEITEEHSATVKTKLNGALINRMSHVEKQLSDIDDGALMTGIERTMDQASAILADAIKEDEYDKSLFYGVYERDGPEALGIIVERVFDAIGEESDTKNRQ